VIDFRYHALALTAVFVALTIGLLLGVTIGDQGLVSSAEHDLRSSLKSDVREARAKSEDLRQQLKDGEKLQEDLYPLVVGRKLEGMRIGLLAVGDVQDQTVKEVRTALSESGGDLTSVTVLKSKPDGVQLLKEAGGGHSANMGAGSHISLLERFGRKLGIQYVRGGKSIKRLRRLLFKTSSGDLSKLDAVVITYTPNDSKVQSAFEGALVDGIRREAQQVVGVELSTTKESQIKWFEDRGVSSVDDIDEFSGRVALVLALAGAEGNFGTKSSADALFPRVLSTSTEDDR